MEHKSFILADVMFKMLGMINIMSCIVKKMCNIHISVLCTEYLKSIKSLKQAIISSY